MEHFARFVCSLVCNNNNNNNNNNNDNNDNDNNNNNNNNDNNGIILSFLACIYLTHFSI